MSVEENKTELLKQWGAGLLAMTRITKDAETAAFILDQNTIAMQEELLQNRLEKPELELLRTMVEYNRKTSETLRVFTREAEDIIEDTNSKLIVLRNEATAKEEERIKTEFSNMLEKMEFDEGYN